MPTRTVRDEETGEAMTDEQLRVEVTTFLLAGQETTSLALTWIGICSRSTRPRSGASRTRLTWRSVAVRRGLRRSREPPDTRMVIDEAMRLYPPAWGLRQALGDDQGGGFRLPRGFFVFVIPYVLHRLPAFWHESGRVDPGSGSHRNAAPIGPKFVYLPFGAGPRQCIGNRVRPDRGPPGAGDPGATLPAASRAGPPRRSVASDYVASPRFGMPMVIERRTDRDERRIRGDLPVLRRRERDLTLSRTSPAASSRTARCVIWRVRVARDGGERSIDLSRADGSGSGSAADRIRRRDTPGPRGRPPSGLPMWRNGPPGTFVVFTGRSSRVSATDQIGDRDDSGAGARVGFGGMRFAGMEAERLIFHRVREMHPEEQLSPARSRIMVLSMEWISSISIDGHRVNMLPR